MVSTTSAYSFIYRVEVRAGEEGKRPSRSVVPRSPFAVGEGREATHQGIGAPQFHVPPERLADFHHEMLQDLATHERELLRHSQEGRRDRLASLPNSFAEKATRVFPFYLDLDPVALHGVEEGLEEATAEVWRHLAQEVLPRVAREVSRCIRASLVRVLVSRCPERKVGGGLKFGVHAHFVSSVVDGCDRPVATDLDTALAIRDEVVRVVDGEHGLPRVGDKPWSDAIDDAPLKNYILRVLYNGKGSKDLCYYRPWFALTVQDNACACEGLERMDRSRALREFSVRFPDPLPGPIPLEASVPRRQGRGGHRKRPAKGVPNQPHPPASQECKAARTELTRRQREVARAACQSLAHPQITAACGQPVRAEVDDVLQVDRTPTGNYVVKFRTRLAQRHRLRCPTRRDVHGSNHGWFVVRHDGIEHRCYNTECQKVNRGVYYFDVATPGLRGRKDAKVGTAEESQQFARRSGYMQQKKPGRMDADRFQRATDSLRRIMEGTEGGDGDVEAAVRGLLAQL